MKPVVRRVEFDARELVEFTRERVACMDSAARTLAAGDVLLLRCRSSHGVKAQRLALAHRALELIRAIMVENYGLPAETYVEADEESLGTPVAPFHGRRFLLPHQDGGHCTYLTPSRVHCSDFYAEERVFTKAFYFKRPSHKLYQGFVITRAGQPKGETYYYDMIAMLWDAYVRREGCAPRDVARLARFCAANVRHSRGGLARHGSRYMSLGASLGAPDFAYHVMPSGPRAESELWPEQYARLPQLCALADQCPCGQCEGAGGRLLCHACRQTLGCSWPELRKTYEVSVSGEDFDILLANNLTLMHAAESQAERTIQPVCLVVDSPDTDAYESWLATQWTQSFERVERVERKSA